MSQMIIGGAVINLSNLIWADTADLVQKERAVFLIQDFQNENSLLNSRSYFLISFGEHRVEDGVASRVYLAVLREDRNYVMEPMEGYMEARDEGVVFDLLKLPGKIHGVRLHKAACFQRTALNRWQDGVFHREDGNQDRWTMEGGNMVIFVIGGNAAGKVTLLSRILRTPDMWF